MSPEAKMRTLAQQDATLQSWFFTDNQIRWFDRQLTPGYLKLNKACVRVRRISTVRTYTHETDAQLGLSELTQPRFQIDVLDYDSERARSAAAAIIDWLATVDFSSDAQSASPETSRHANFVLNQRAGMETTIQPPAYVESLDVRIFCMEE